MAVPGKIHLHFFPEPQSLSSKKDREKRNLRYVPPAPRPHHIRSAPTQTRLIHSRSDFLDLDNSFQLLHTNGSTQTFFRQYFEIQERLGFGSFGDVFRVKSKLDGTEYAIKKSRKTYTGEGDRSRQLREVQRVVNIPTNLHLVELERAWEEDGHLYLQMELCLKSLNQEIEDSQSADAEEPKSFETEAWNVLVDMLLALRHLHSHNLVHMDVKPDNIFLTRDVPPVYKLGDFGIVVCLEEQQDVSEFTEGDSRYLAPEAIQGYVSTKADVFSLGLTILEMACQVDLPKSGELWHRLRAGGDLPEPCDKLVPASMQRVLKLMLQPDAKERPEVSELLKLAEVKEHWRRRYWTLTGALVKKKLQGLSRFWHSFLCFLMSLIFFTRKDNADQSTSIMEFRATPEPFPEERPSAAVPDLLLNDTSFSDMDDDPPSCDVSYDASSRTSTPIFASTPISHSKTRSGGRLRSGRTSRVGHDGEIRPMGSPTSRNLLKEFEAVSE